MHQPTKIYIWVIAVLLTGTFINPAFSILSENKPKKYNLTPVKKEQPPTNNSEPQSEDASKGTNSPNINSKSERDKIARPKEYINKITITSQRIDAENINEETPTPLLSDTLSDLRKSLNQDAFLEFVPSTPENDFITLSALDIIVSDTKNNLSGLLAEPSSVDAEPNCQTDLATCNTQLLSSISTRLEQLEFLKNSKQALGEPTTIPEIRLESQSPLTENEIALAFLAPNITEKSMENPYTSPSDFSYAIRDILKNKDSIFEGSKTGFRDNLNILQSQLRLTRQSNPNLPIDILKTGLTARDSNLSNPSTQQTIQQLDDFVEFVGVKKIVINDDIITSDMDTGLLPSQLFNTLEQEALPITSLYDLIGYYISNGEQPLQENETLNSQILV